MPKEVDLAGYLQSREGCEDNKSLAELCVMVRDFPFEHIVYEHHLSYSELIDDFSKRKKGACSAKHYFLGEALSRRQYEVKYITTPFFWKDLAIGYPVHLRNLASLMPIQLHLSLEVKSNGTAIPIDATWDERLEKAGFPVSHFENGINTNIPAVRSMGDGVIHNSGLDRFLYIESIKSTMTPIGIEPEFYNELNLWLNKIREG